MKKFLVFLCSILLFSASIGTASALTIGNDIINRPELDGATNIAFIDPTLVFPTAGTLDSWSFWATGGTDGDWHDWAAQIYRYTGTGSDWQLVYNLKLSSIGSGAYNEVFPVPFDIQAGDVVGWWFGEDGGTIPFTFTGTDDVEWSNYLSAAILDPIVGDIYSFDTEEWARSSQMREYSIAANYTPAPVPEPATMLLLGTGLIGLAGASRKKIKKQSS